MSVLTFPKACFLLKYFGPNKLLKVFLTQADIL